MIPPFIKTWEDHRWFWTEPDYHHNWKIMCCGEMGTTALAFRESVPDLSRVLQPSLEGVLDILDHVPPEGDWPEGATYWSGTLGHGLRFGLALHRATEGSVSLFDHPSLAVTGDYLSQLVEPDGLSYDFGDKITSYWVGVSTFSCCWPALPGGVTGRAWRGGVATQLSRSWHGTTRQ